MREIPTPIKKAILVGVVVIIAVIALASRDHTNGLAITGEAAPITIAGNGYDAPNAGFSADPGSLGEIPDAVGCAPSPGAPRDVTFTVTGVAGAPTSVSVNVTMAHTWVGDLIATLIAPTGANIVVFGRTGATSTPGGGDSSNLGGTYFFSDTAVAPPSGGWWQEAAALGSGEVMTPGTYRSTALGGPGQVNPAPATDLSAAFVGFPNVNGTWILRLTDGCSGDTGNVSAALLTLNGTGSQHVVDMNGDGRTDWSIVRNIGGGPGGQVAWFTKYNGVAGTQTDVFGSATDWFVSEDFDGDNKSDVAVWRPNPVAAFFYIMRSQTATFQAIQWGITGDDPTVLGDYDGDGKADAAIYRGGASAGQQSFWHILKSSDGGYLPIQWGQNGDFVAPGDYDGDGRQDAAVQRSAGGGSAIFFIRFFNGTFSQTVFGTPTDFIVPGDYDGDGKTDISTVRGIAGQINWFYDPSSIPGTQVVQTLFGVSGDSLTQGDYDGDGRTDQAIWRQSPTPGQSAFFVNGSSSGFFAFPWGASGDIPVASYDAH